MLRFLAAIIVVFAAGAVHAQRPFRYDVEMKSGEHVQAIAVRQDSDVYRDTIWVSETLAPRVERMDKVRRILSIADPIHPPLDIRDPIDTCIGCGPPPDCDCKGHSRQDGLQLLDAKGGVSIRGSSTYTRASPTGPIYDTARFFDPFHAGGTMLDVEVGSAIGWRAGRWDFGLQLEVIPTDSFWFFPLSLHARYQFSDNCCAWNVFANLGIPFDFQTGAPIVITPLVSDRQRRYMSFGVGKLWPFDERVTLAADLGFRYMVIPLAQIQCCPSIAYENRFPARESKAFFFQFGVSF